MNDKNIKPPYTSYRSFVSLMNELRDHDVMPAAIDRSLLSRRSGSEQSALIATLKWFKLIDETGIPTKLLEDYIAVDEDAAKAMLKNMVVTAYGQITDGTFNLRSATTSQLADQFRQYDIGGSTLAKSVTFFLSAAKDAGIFVSPHAKAPPMAGGGSSKRKAKPAAITPATTAAPAAIPAHRPPPPPTDGMISIPIPIFGGKNGAIMLPDRMTEKQWNSVVKMTQYILENYRETMGEEAAPTQEEDDL
ncbi:DUF5343 domain-containing protein [Pseudoxanthomonas winnipegensis]|uniref:DUF5343 domain-containing protein n=1 Tax=Pseudoxanthomonas winnipegensis TaxID=2480810 RepID=A0A4Q8M150_9GAMM|nr:DUF5343 domain-containing protein [Pseudoxanthomonas winnipegensis]RZZ86985.1 hypothetical protein EA663_08955 [Pseudoxanthomonas winnipegensis]TAA37799.1 hypothetical protein EA656_03835 [Pseudoxanthomonas winnipegensis]